MEHFQGIEPAGKLDQRTYAALQKEKSKRVTANYNNTPPKKVENGNKGTGNTADFIDSPVPQGTSNNMTALNIISLVTLYQNMSATERIEALINIANGSNNTLIKAGVVPGIIVNEPQKMVENFKAAVQFQLNIGTNFEDPDMAEAFASVFTAYVTGKLIEGIKLPFKGTVKTTTVSTLKTSELNTTQGLTMSKNQFKSFVETIKTEGIKEPIKYVEYNGQKYVVDGHHRLQAAKQLGIKDVPVEKVELPYKGYKIVEDLFW
ncbi:ParB-like nuclease domain protein [Ruminiclostridium hungatei]|uniref:ParB-like nuclease domain protein n=1 Tax=Ruminiclostridium hungatei TaxID=48256 RepID=A0A1V4SDP6_RUMHU|nr:ParB-like nuclease domain protein [Ruminiclostridium hungatei]